MRIPVLTLALSLATLAVSSGCDPKPVEAKPADAKAGDAKTPAANAGDIAAPEASATLPTETETLALDQGQSKIPATIEVPRGCTTFNDDETTIRVDYGEGRDSGELFGIQIAKGNEYNTDLGELEKMMLENKYGSTNEIIEKTDTLLRYTMKAEGGEPHHHFELILDLGGTKWVCKQGNYGGYSEAQVQRQIEACKTLKAK